MVGRDLQALPAVLWDVLYDRACLYCVMQCGDIEWSLQCSSWLHVVCDWVLHDNGQLCSLLFFCVLVAVRDSHGLSVLPSWVLHVEHCLVLAELSRSDIVR